MNIIQKFIPKNPINAGTKDKIGREIKSILEVFGKNYLMATKKVIVKTKEIEVAQKEKRKAYVEADKKKKIKYYTKKYGSEAEIPEIPEPPEKGSNIDIMREYCEKIFDAGFKPVMPRGKYTPLKSPELKVEVTRYELRDIFFDPYACYIIQTSKGEQKVETERRFKEFEKLHKAIKKIAPKDAVLPPASSKLGSRNLDPNFLRERVSILGKYLETVSKDPEVQKNVEFQKFIGIYPSDNPTFDEIFNLAFTMTKQHFGYYYSLVWDTPSDGITKLVIRRVYKAIESDIENALPKVEAARRASKKLVIKAISVAAGAAIPPAWSLLEKGTKPMITKINDLLGKLVQTLFEKKIEVNNQLKEKMIEGIKPIKDGVSMLFTKALPAILPGLLKPFAKLIKIYNQKCEPLILDSFKECKKDKLTEGINNLVEPYNSMLKELQESMDKSLEVTFKSLDGQVTFVYAVDCFSPLRQIGKILHDFIKIVDPKHFGKIAEAMFDFKKKLDNCDGENVESHLSDMERNVYWDIKYEYWDIDDWRYVLRFHLSEIGLEKIGDVGFKLGKVVNKRLFKRVVKRFLYKFSDYVWGFSVKSDDDKPWPDKVNEAFNLAYYAAKKKFNKECAGIIKEGIRDILQGMFLEKVIESILQLVDPLFKTLEPILAPIKDLVDIREMALGDIREVLESVLINAVNEQEEPFSKLLNEAIENCQV